jgi:hypothetical protein
MTDNPGPLLASSEANLPTALAAAPNHAWAHYNVGKVLAYNEGIERGIEEVAHALAIDPNFAMARADFGFAHVFIGRAGETEAHVREALRLRPSSASSPPPNQEGPTAARAGT